MPLPTVSNTDSTEVTFVRLAREIAMDLHNIETILENHGISIETWSKYQQTERFKKLLEAEISAWNSATNTQERTKLKAAAFIEEWLPKAFQQLHEGDLTSPKVELAKLVSSIAGISKTATDVAGAGERFHVTINLGGEAQLKFEKTVTPQVIEHLPTLPTET